MIAWGLAVAFVVGLAVLGWWLLQDDDSARPTPETTGSTIIDVDGTRREKQGPKASGGGP